MPEASLLLAQHLAKHQRVAEALALCEQVSGKVVPELMVQAAVTVLRVGSGTPEQQGIVEGWISKAISTQPKNAMFHILLAEVRDLGGRHNDALSLYRQILQGEPANVVALNNLAFLMALKKEGLQEASVLIDKAIAIAGPQAPLLDTRAIVVLQQGRVKQAIQDLQQAVAQGGSAEHYFHMAWAQLQDGNPKAAAHAYAEALDRGLDADKVHALERTVFQELAAQVGKLAGNQKGRQ
jgi:Tfp pilus assembly protein PilF